MATVNPRDRSRTAGVYEKKRRWLTAFVPRRLEFYLSPAWSLAPRPLKTIIERLEVEHLRHGGYRNGELFVSYSQFVEAGVSRRTVRPALELGERLGLLEVFRDENPSGDIRPENRYRLTYVPAMNRKTPTDEWMSITGDQAEALVSEFRKVEKAAARAERKAVA